MRKFFHDCNFLNILIHESKCLLWHWILPDGRKRLPV